MQAPPPMLTAGLILTATLIVFALGKSPLFRVDRAGAAIIGAALTIGLGVLSFDQAAQAVDYRTLTLLFAMMIVTANLKLSGFFTRVGNALLGRVRTRRQLLLAVVLASGLLSAFFINDIVCLLFTPVVLLICRRAKLPPVPYLIAVATASNIGSAGTLIGNPQNILIGSLSGLPFARYLAVAFPFALAGLALNYAAVAWVYRRDLAGPVPATGPLAGVRHAFLMRKSLAATLLILAGFLLGANPVLVAAVGGAWLLLTRRIKPDKVYAGIDFNLLVVFVGLFVIIGGVERSGLMDRLVQAMGPAAFRDFRLFSLWTVVLSNVFSNVPAVLLLRYFIPGAGAAAGLACSGAAAGAVSGLGAAAAAGAAGSGVGTASVAAAAGGVAASFPPDLWWTGLAVFSTIAGNLTLLGSIANLIVAELARRDGVEIRFLEYLKVGLPLTVVLTAAGLLYFWLLR